MSRRFIWLHAAFAFLFGLAAHPAFAQSLTGTKPGEERDIAGLHFSWCPPGKFLMGSPASELGHRPDEQQVEVTLTRGFWMSRFEATQDDWRRVIPELPGGITYEGEGIPMHSVSYDEASNYCARLTELARINGQLPPNWEIRIPGEAEWEYACRAGTTTATAFGDSLTSVQANFAGKSYNTEEQGPKLNRAVRVGSYTPNAWGIYDMHGNQFEWTRDWYHTRLPGGVDPDLSTKQGAPNRDGTYSRARRGGAFVEQGAFCRSACRLRYEPPRRSDHIGFRVLAADVASPSN